MNNIRSKYGNLTYLHNTLISRKRTLIISEHDYGIKKKHHNRHNGNDKSRSHSTLLCKVIRCLMEFILFVVLTHESLNNTHTYKVFLNYTVYVINLFLHLLKHWEAELHNKRYYNDNYRKHNKKRCRHFRINSYCHNCRNNQKRRTSYQNTK